MAAPGTATVPEQSIFRVQENHHEITREFPTQQPIVVTKKGISLILSRKLSLEKEGRGEKKVEKVDRGKYCILSPFLSLLLLASTQSPGRALSAAPKLPEGENERTEAKRATAGSAPLQVEAAAVDSF